MVTVFLHIYDERGHHVLGTGYGFERHDVVLHRPQTLIPSSRGTTSSGPDRVSSGTTWCFTARKPLFHRRGAPRPQDRIGFRAARRGASPPANPYSFVAGHHVLGTGYGFERHDVVFHRRKPLFHRRGAPRPRPRIGPRPVGRGASPPANPYSIVAGHHVLRTG